MYTTHSKGYQLFIQYNALHTLECYHTISHTCNWLWTYKYSMHTSTVCIHIYIEEPNLLTKSICLISVSVAFSEMFPTNTVVATLMSEADTLFCTGRIIQYTYCLWCRTITHTTIVSSGLGGAITVRLGCIWLGSIVPGGTIPNNPVQS